jgi:hypothetical protein
MKNIPIGAVPLAVEYTFLYFNHLDKNIHMKSVSLNITSMSQTSQVALT